VRVALNSAVAFPNTRRLRSRTRASRTRPGSLWLVENQARSAELPATGTDKYLPRGPHRALRCFPRRPSRPIASRLSPRCWERVRVRAGRPERRPVRGPTKSRSRRRANSVRGELTSQSLIGSAAADLSERRGTPVQQANEAPSASSSFWLQRSLNTWTLCQRATSRRTMASIGGVLPPPPKWANRRCFGVGGNKSARRHSAE
jgi:hypothetical protein